MTTTATVDPTPPIDPAEAPRRLSEEIDGLLSLVGEEPLHLRDIIRVMRGRAYTLLLVLMALPFCSPIPLPISTPFGLVIAIIGLRLALAQKPWLPGRVLDAALSPKWLRPTLNGARRVARAIEVLLRPRLTFLVDFAPMHCFYGTMICLCGLALLLPLPIPFTNTMPAIAISFLAAGMLERDGIAIIAGTIGFVMAGAFFFLIFLGGAEAVGWIKHWFGFGD